MTESLNAHAMILAAGRGERMRPLTDSCPKPLLKAGGKSLIQWHIEALVRAGFVDLVINHAHLGQMIVETIGTGVQFGARIQYSEEAPVALETAGGIAKALPKLGTQPFLVVNGDVFTNIDFSGLKNRLSSWPEGCLAHLVMVNNPSHHPAGDFVLSEEGKLRDKSEAEQQPALTFSGIGLYHPKLFRDVAVNEPAKLAPLLRQAMLHQQVTGEHFEGMWSDIGTPQRLEELDKALSARKLA